MNFLYYTTISRSIVTFFVEVQKLVSNIAKVIDN